MDITFISHFNWKLNLVFIKIYLHTPLFMLRRDKKLTDIKHAPRAFIYPNAFTISQF